MEAKVNRKCYFFRLDGGDLLDYLSVMSYVVSDPESESESEPESESIRSPY